LNQKSQASREADVVATELFPNRSDVVKSAQAQKSKVSSRDEETKLTGLSSGKTPAAAYIGLNRQSSRLAAAYQVSLSSESENDATPLNTDGGES